MLNKQNENKMNLGKLNYDTIVKRAFVAWSRTSDIPVQPASSSGLREYKGREYVVLENSNGVLAVYRVKNDGYLKFLKRWPKGLEDTFNVM